MSKDEFSEDQASSPALDRFHFMPEGGRWRVQPRGGSELPLLRELCADNPAWLDSTPTSTPVQALVGMLMVQARHAGMELSPKGLLHDPTLELRRLPAKRSEEGVLYPFDGLGGIYAGHWGLNDLYPEHETALRNAFGSGRPFDTREFGAKKEIQFARIWRDAVGVLHLRVRCEADDPLALADTALWSAAKEAGNLCDSGLDVLLRRGLAEEEAEQVLADLADDAQVPDPNEEVLEKRFPVLASFEELTGWMDRLVDECEEALNLRYQRLRAVAAAWLESRPK